MKTVIQLDALGYFSGFTTADPSPLEEGVFLMPAGSIDTQAPSIPSGKIARWEGEWAFEDIPEPAPEPEPEFYAPTYADLRAMAYPPITDYLDGVVKGNQAQIDKYITDCLAVKALYPKPE